MFATPPSTVLPHLQMRSSFDFERIKDIAEKYQYMYHSFCPSSHQHVMNMRTGLRIQDTQCRRSPANVDWFMRMIIVNIVNHETSSLQIQQHAYQFGAMCAVFVYSETPICKRRFAKIRNLCLTLPSTI